eukprot:TRINITY_DN4582_c0_g1_i1.p1 TRINITY_DN4582_c0_g1~~TRINITY_DN4582_c0_g1_i1.p1  ORF type:complete len:359 (+),score=52.95 TRINITY_DN4582_c0_g1_i1:155-1078(+)
MPRILHWVFKVPQRSSTIQFYRDVLRMKVLRHEEFTEGCAAACNGPYDGKWSKSMVGYGPEDSHFVVELTYNYTVKSYDLGNDYNCITIKSKEAFKAAREQTDYVITDATDTSLRVAVTGGYQFKLVNEDVAAGEDPVQSLTLNVTDLQRSIEYWHGLLGMNIISQDDAMAELSYEAAQASLILRHTPEALEHGTAYGRVAFACPADKLPGIQSKAEGAGHKVLTPLVSLDTPGKATVQVVILADPDGYEICFVGDEAFRELSQVDPEGDKLLDEAMQADGSDEWHVKWTERKAAADAKRAAQAQSK